MEKDISFICSMEGAFHINKIAKGFWQKKLELVAYFVFPDSCYAVYAVVKLGPGRHVALLILYINMVGGSEHLKSPFLHMLKFYLWCIACEEFPD